MRLSPVSAAASLLWSAAVVWGQTYTDCNPLHASCPADLALGKSITYDFTHGASSDFKVTGNPTYDGNGVGFTVAKQGDGPLIESKWYIMFGKVEYVIKAAPGQGIVSSAVLQSDDLDEIDWEWLGGDDAQVQTNYFGKGDTSTYNRGGFSPAPGNHDGFHTYTIEWTSSQVVWQIDGQTVRVLTPATADANQYPQTPMVVKVGVWAGGDPNNAPGTIQWAGGPTNYAAGPFTMYMKSLSVTDYSTGNSYSYGDNSGSWQSIRSNGGEVNGNAGGAPAPVVSSPSPAPAPTTSDPSPATSKTASQTTTDPAPIPWSGTHKDTTTTSQSGWPWTPTTMATAASASASTSALPGTWTVSGTGHVQPPGTASSGPQSTSASSASPTPTPPFGPEPFTTATSVVVVTPSGSAATSVVVVTPSGAAATPSSSSSAAQVAPSAAAAIRSHQGSARFGAVCAIFGCLVAFI